MFSIFYCQNIIEKLEHTNVKTQKEGYSKKLNGPCNRQGLGRGHTTPHRTDM